MDLKDLEEYLNNLIENLSPLDKRSLIARLSSLKSVFPLMIMKN